MMIGKENEPPSQQQVGIGEEKKGEKDALGAIAEQESLVLRFMEWWAAGNGERVAAEHPILAAVEPTYLSEIISAGAGYHHILTIDRLDGMQRRLGSGSEPALEPLRRALQTRGGAKAQARAVGMLLFKEAKTSFELYEAGGQLPTSGKAGSKGGAEPPATPRPKQESELADARHAGGQAVNAEAPVLDEIFDPPRAYVCTSNFPESAQIAARAAPTQDAALVTTFPYGTVFNVSATAGVFLRICFADDDDSGRTRIGYVPQVVSGLQLLEPQQKVPVAVVLPEHAAVSASPGPCPEQLLHPTTPPKMANLGSSSSQQEAASYVGATPLQAVPFTCFQALEDKVAKQEIIIRSLQAELAELKSHLGSAAASLAAVAASHAASGPPSTPS
mmetsp:Transcript_58837/g.140309  ORF Transcript_58837/g.140309 Transcript_58837/m.140309 type:complete len:389 (+) Transcript_58837:58-1224(+)